MTKEELISKWQKEMELFDIAKNKAATPFVFTAADTAHDTISSILEDIKNLNEETVKQKKFCHRCEEWKINKFWIELCEDCYLEITEDKIE